MIYVPSLEYSCYVVIDSNTIRAYDTIPTYNTTINYRDYYVNSSYIYKDGFTSFGTYSSLPTCLDKENLTDRYFYRLDIDKIFIVFFIILFIFYFILKKIIRVFFHGFREA